MIKLPLDGVLKKDKGDLQRIRSVFFPFIAQKLITGYNIYSQLFDFSSHHLFLSYLHSHLQTDDKHFQELSDRLRTVEELDLQEKITLHNKLIDRREVVKRDAYYLTRREWNDPEDMRYFSLNGQEVSPEQAATLESVIGESLQYDLLIRIQSKDELRRVIDIFKMYASKHVLDKKGKKIMEEKGPKINGEAITNSFDIPLLTCITKNSRKPKNLIDFLVVKQFSVQEIVGQETVVLKTLVRTNADLFHVAIKQVGYTTNAITIDKQYALRVFIEDYIENA